ncbi:MAG: T9SS type A sorting domain-containing protein [Bacteroidia bacterium]|nr:T9SS type A sorting domain-containing protein [Bacteroidia bacterium]
MKRLLLTFFALLTYVAAQSQATQVWCENFDGGTISTTSTGVPGWSIDNNYFVSSANSLRGEYQSGGGPVYLTSPVFNTLGQNFVILDFKQICKIEFTDKAEIEYSLNNGATWTKFDATAGTGNVTYQGTGVFQFNNNSFTEGSYLDWAPGTPTAPTNAWWKAETFDISTAVGNQATVQIRFVMTDVVNGLAGRYGWLLDDICVTAAPCELVDPTASAPVAGNPFWSGTVFNLGPFDLFAYINDQSGIADTVFGPGFATLNYTVNGGATQTTLMVNLFDSVFAGQIPAAIAGDTICWWIEATDNSGCNNTVRYPAIGEICFYPVDGISFPYCDNFDIQNQLWTPDPNAQGSQWTWGPPTGPTLTSANSAPNVWGVGDIGGVGSYSPNTNSALISPVFDFSTTTVANLSFWQNRDVEGFWDGVRLEFSNDGGITWTVIGTVNDPNATNWYTNASIVSSGLPAWDGPGTGPSGWIESRYKLGTVPGIGGSTAVQFRYVFTCDASVQNSGFHLDDFCIIVPCNDDLGVTTIVSPLPGSGQPAGGTTDITVTIENFGQMAQSTFNVGWSINGTVQPSIPFAGTLAAGATTSFTIPNTPVLPNSYTICVWTELVGDCIDFNDTTCANFIGIPTLTPSPSYCDDFESGNIGWSNQLAAGANAGTIWELGSPAFGQTNSANSGANAWDVNLNSAYTNQANCELYTPYFDFSTIGAGRIQFALNYNCENAWDGTRLEYSNDNGVTWTIVGGGSAANPDPCGTNWYTDDQLNSSNQPAWTGNSGGWIQSAYKLCCTSGIFNNPTPIQFRFVFTSDFSVITDGFSMDDFCIYAAQGDDVGITAITQPVGGAPVGQSTPVVVTLENFGATTITSTPITYTVNGINPQTITWTGSLPPCGITTVVLPNFTFGQGVQTICAWTSLPTDLEPSNDTTCADVIGQPIITPTYITSYFDNFDAGNIGWAPYIAGGGNPATIWEYGTPAFGATTGAYSAPTCWDVNLNSAPGGNANTYVTTPFFDFSNAQAAILRFYQNRVIYAFGDKFYIEYSVNNGPWQLLQPSTQIVTNWYNNNDSWDDNSGGWIQSIFKDVTSAVGGTVPLVQFRFVYTSAAFTNGDGVSFDNFELFVPIPLSVKTVQVNTSVPCQFIFPGQPITFAAPINNNGINTVFNHNISLVIDGALVSNDPVSYAPNGLLPDSTRTHNFNNTWIAVPGFHEVCVYTDSPNGSTDLNQFDDTSCVTVLVFDSVATSQLPYCTSFESGNQWVTSNSITYCDGSTWEIGTPAKPNLSGAHTGNIAWTTNLTGNYANKDSSGLFSSLFRVEAGHCYKLSFWHEFRMEYGSDGGALDYSVDYGQTWNRLDLTGTPNIQLYGISPNYTYVSELDPTDPSQKGFTGIRNNWIYNEKTFRPDVNSQLVVRWRFASDFSATDEGWSIDDVCFEDLGPCTPLGVNDFAVNDFGMSQNYPNPADQLTTFEFMIPAQGQVRIVLTDVIGQIIDVIADENTAAGKHTIQYSTAGIAPGLYTYTMTYEGQQITKRMIITR